MAPAMVTRDIAGRDEVNTSAAAMHACGCSTSNIPAPPPSGNSLECLVIRGSTCDALTSRGGRENKHPARMDRAPPRRHLDAAFTACSRRTRRDAADCEERRTVQQSGGTGRETNYFVAPQRVDRVTVCMVVCVHRRCRCSICQQNICSMLTTYCHVC